MKLKKEKDARSEKNENEILEEIFEIKKDASKKRKEERERC